MKTAADQIVKCPNCGANNRVKTMQQVNQAPVCGRCKTPLSVSQSPLTVTDANFSDIVGDSSLPVLLDFWATWCPPCKMVAPIIDSLARELAGKAVIGKLDVDKNPITAGRFNVQSIPTLIIFEDGNEVDRIVGAGSKESILRRLQPFMA